MSRRTTAALPAIAARIRLSPPGMGPAQLAAVLATSAGVAVGALVGAAVGDAPADGLEVGGAEVSAGEAGAGEGAAVGVAAKLQPASRAAETTSERARVRALSGTAPQW